MCNLYSITTNQGAIIALFRVINRYVGNVAPMRSVFPNYPAPVTGNTGTKPVASLATLDQARGDDLPLPVFFDDA